MILLRHVLEGKKKLLPLIQAQSIPKIPRFAEINISKLWNEIKEDPMFGQFFPDAYLVTKKVPDRTFFFTTS